MTQESREGDREAVNRDRHVSLFSSHDYLLALLAGILAFILYFRTLAPGLLFADSAEFQMAAWLGGFVHPTGYPLYLLLGNIWTHLLPAGDPAWRMNLLSAIWGALAVGLVYLLALRIVLLWLRPGEASSIASRLAALFAALAFAATPTFWSQAIITEVYTLNAALVAAVFLGLTIWGAQPADVPSILGRPSVSPLYWTAAIYGLSLSHHRATLLLLPAIVVFLWLERERLRRAQAGLKVLLLALALVLLPLLIYLYIPLRGPYTPYATIVVSPQQTLQLYRPTLDWFIRHISGQAFGSALSSPGGLPGAVMERLAPTARLAVSEVSWIGLGLGIVGLIGLARRSGPLLALTGLSLLAVVAFNLLYAIGDIFVFYIPVYLIWILWAALGVIALSALLRRGITGNALRHGRRRADILERLLPLVPCALAFVVPVQSLAQNYGRLDRSEDNQARASWQAILGESPAPGGADSRAIRGADPIPPDAILVSNDRDEMVPLWYLQYVEGVRPDLTGLFPLIQPTPDWADVGQVVLTALGSGRPVLLIKPMPGMETRFQLEPAGSLVRVTGPAVHGPPQTPTDLDFGGAVRLTGYQLSPGRLRAGEQMGVTLYWQPLQELDADYTSFVHLVNGDGAVVGASDHLPGDVYYPSSLWRSGDILRDTHTFTLTTDLGRPPYAIEVGLYTNAPTLEHLGRPEKLEITAAG